MRSPVLLAFFVMLSAAPLVAGVSITEVMYDPQGKDNFREYVEVEAGETDLEGWLIADNASSDSLVLVSRGSNGLALIVEEGSQIDAGEASVYHVGATIGNNLNNKGDIIVLIDGVGVEVDRLVYQSSDGGSNNGKSLCRDGETMVECEPTPGKQNQLTQRTFEKYLEAEQSDTNAQRENERLINDITASQKYRRTSSSKSANTKNDGNLLWYAMALFFAGVLICLAILGRRRNGQLVH